MAVNKLAHIGAVDFIPSGLARSSQGNSITQDNDLQINRCVVCFNEVKLGVFNFQDFD